MKRGRWLVMGAILALAVPGESPASHPRACPDGIYVVEGAPIFPSLGSSAVKDAVVVDHGTVAIESGCEAAPASIREGRDGLWRVRSSWIQCGGASRVRLRAVISSDCRRMTGVVETRRPRSLRRFAARACADPPLCDIACASNEECPDDAYCARRPGECLGDGTCAPRGQACPTLWAPVCGCDGSTYTNACEAAASGVNVARLGACDRSCDVTRPCGPGRFCELPPGVCASDLDAGMCVEFPQSCPDDVCRECNTSPCPLCPILLRPVCGCDGVTYAGECERRKAGVSKAHDGPCECVPVVCAPGTEPADRDGDGCPEACLARCESACDCAVNPAIRLNNDCPLLCATCGDHWTCQKGYCVEECGPIPTDMCRICGGIAGLPCGRDEVCDLPPGLCDYADLFGVCKARPDLCMTVHLPVCGCDGRTYGNDCDRLAAGVQKAHDGECGR